MNIFQLSVMAIAWTIIIYTVNCLIARQIKTIDVSKATYYVSAMSMLGVIGEILIDSIYRVINGGPLWVYRVMPIHGGYTSFYSIVIWGMVGFQLYLIHDTLAKKKITDINRLAIFFAVEAILLEGLFNFSFLAIYGKFVYYYLPNDIWHITSLQAFPLYLIAGYISIYAIKQFSTYKRTSSVAFCVLTVSVVFVR